MENIKSIVEGLHLDNHLVIEELPNIDLYMDQVIQIFESKLDDTKRNPEDKVITKTMINNYAKGKLFFPVQNKKYTKQHLLLISLIYQLKGALSINDIKITLDRLNKKIVEEEFELGNFYESYLRLTEDNIERFNQDIEKCTRDVTEEVSKLQNQDGDYLEQVLLITSLVNMSNFYRRLAEKLVDDLAPIQVKEEKNKTKEEKNKGKEEKAKKNKE